MAVNRTSLQVVPDNLYFSGAALGRVKGRRGSCVLVTTPSDVVIFGDGESEVWRAPLRSTSFVSAGRDSIRLTYGDDSIEFSTGLSSPKKLLAHLPLAKEAALKADEITDQIRERERESRTMRQTAASETSPDHNRSNRFAESAQKQREKNVADARDRETYGDLVLDERFCGTRVRLYAKGYVRLSGFKEGPYEKLTGISATGDVAKKTAVGRLAVASVTGGANLFLSGNKRGELYLAISTDKKTHMLNKAVGGVDKEIANMHKIAAAGQAILDNLKSAPSVPSQQIPAAPRSASSSVADQLDRLIEMNRSGALSDEEFRLAKVRLLSNE
jgi:hypothetical protein